MFATTHWSVVLAAGDADSPQAVEQNLLRIKNRLGLDRLISARQVHGDTIHVIDESSLALAAGGGGDPKEGV